jgi:hypothetical protein
MDNITLSPGQSINVIIDGHTISLEHLVDGSGYHALSLGGVDCDLEGEQPGLYYPAALAKP